MFKLIGRLLAKISLAQLAREIDLDIDTVERADGLYLRVRVEAFGRAVVDRLVPLARWESGKFEIDEDNGTAKRLLRFDTPIDVHDPPGVNLPEWTRKANERLQRSLERQPLNQQ